MVTFVASSPLPPGNRILEEKANEMFQPWKHVPRLFRTETQAFCTRRTLVAYPKLCTSQPFFTNLAALHEIRVLQLRGVRILYLRV